MTLENNTMNRKTLLLWIHSSLDPDHTPPLLLQVRFRDGIISYFLLSVLSCKVPLSIEVQDIARGKEDFMSKLSAQDCFPCGNAAGLCMLAIARAVCWVRQWEQHCGSDLQLKAHSCGTTLVFPQVKAWRALDDVLLYVSTIIYSLVILCGFLSWTCPASPWTHVNSTCPPMYCSEELQSHTLYKELRNF